MRLVITDEQIMFKEIESLNCVVVDPPHISFKVFLNLLFFFLVGKTLREFVKKIL